MGRLTRKPTRGTAARDLKATGAVIRLQNPVAHHYEPFIFGNALLCDRVVEEDSARGQHIVICGAGPTLRDTAPTHARLGDQLWGANSGLTWLVANGYAPTHGITVDQTADMLAEWASTPDVEYLLATSCHPHLSDLLKSRGRARRYFHNYVGVAKPPVRLEDGRLVAYEDWLYMTLFPSTMRAGSGLNTVTRAIDVALFMGAAKVTVLGADHCLRVKSRAPQAPLGSPEHLRWLREDVEMHADGGHALVSGASPTTLGGEIDGRWWETKADMVISAVWLVGMKRYLGDRLDLVGDTLPNALMDKPQEFLDRLPTLISGDGTPVRFVPPDPRTPGSAA